MPKGVYERTAKPLPERLWANVQKTDSCWLWQGFPCRKGHGQIMNCGYKPQEPWRRKFQVHRITYEMLKGPIPKGICVCHRCDVPNCVNPDHLFLGTVAQNNLDMVAKRRHAHGTNHYNTKLTPDQVLFVRSSSLSQMKLAKQLGVSKTCIQAIRSGRSWSLLAAQNTEAV
jgi:hypothetical protein